jgi:hypothetical protein
MRAALGRGLPEGRLIMMPCAIRLIILAAWSGHGISPQAIPMSAHLRRPSPAP